MLEEPTVAEEVVRVPPKERRWAAYASLFGALLVMMVFPCMCGHLGREALPVSGAAVVIGLYGWVATQAKLPARIFHIFSFIVAFLVLFKNIVDVLWLGHDAAF